jgi:hypothetical protein
VFLIFLSLDLAAESRFARSIGAQGTVETENTTSIQTQKPECDQIIQAQGGGGTDGGRPTPGTETAAERGREGERTLASASGERNEREGEERRRRG